jgi:hypothetical protein
LSADLKALRAKCKTIEDNCEDAVWNEETQQYDLPEPMREALGQKKDDEDGSGIKDFRMKTYEEQTSEGLKVNPRTEEIGNKPSASVIASFVDDILRVSGEITLEDLTKKVF